MCLCWLDCPVREQNGKDVDDHGQQNHRPNQSLAGPIRRPRQLPTSSPALRVPTRD